MANLDLAEEYRKQEYNEKYPSPCGIFEDGQEFILEAWGVPPKGFCPWAWADIHKEIMLIMGGGNNISLKQEGVAIACCSDGFKPVVFKIERIEN